MILPNTSDKAVFGVGIDTARYGHHVSFLRPRLPAGRRADDRHAIALERGQTETIHFALQSV